MLYRELLICSAIYVGIVISAITRIKPTTLMATTTASAESIRIRVKKSFEFIPRRDAYSLS